MFIAEENQSGAAEWARGLFDSVRPLAQFPEMGRVVPEVGRPEIREIMFRGHRVVYRIAPRRGGVWRGAFRSFDRWPGAVGWRLGSLRERVSERVQES